MPDASDMDLVREYARHNSETAFAELVRRHINLVYSVALRFTGNPGDAQDVTQAVFIILARKADRLREHTIVTGWLYETTRLTAAGFLRAQKRRRAWEQEATMQSQLNAPEGDHLWRQLAPHLEAAMARLGERDRTLLALRFYENKTGAEAAALLGIGEEAAHKRTARALEKLHRYFGLHGITSSTAIIAGELAANSLQVAPTALAPVVTAAALAKGATASASTLTLIKGALKIMAWTKAKTAIVIAVGFVLATSSSVVLVERANRIDGVTESQWIKSIVYRGDYEQVRRWHALRLRGIHILTKALLSPASDRATRMGAANLLGQLSTGLSGNHAPMDETMRQDVKTALPELLRSLQTETDDGVRANVLGCFEELLPVMSDKEKAPFLPEFLRALESDDFSVRNNGLVALRSYPGQAQVVDPVLLPELQDTNVRIRLRAADALVHVDAPAAIQAGAISVLLEILKNPDNQIAWQVPGILADLGSQATSAVPALVASSRGSDQLVAQAASRALRRIDPAALARP